MRSQIFVVVKTTSSERTGSCVLDISVDKCHYNLSLFVCMVMFVGRENRKGY